ncbi:MAG TPA: right-handed parallel beta-helix repeat-containing protein, partial [Niastella sp.]|nr:right-handed parallel beta-helix repeat-containing protein [Niastella sp.]
MRFSTLLLLLFSSLFSLAQNKAYYLNSTGNDANDGSSARPWKTVAPANVFNFEPGDTLFFTGGQTFGSVQLQKNDEGLTLASYNGIATLGPLYAYNVGNITIDGLNFVGAGTVNKLDGIKFYMDSTSFGDNSTIVIKNTSVSNFGGNGILFGAWATSNGYHNVQILDCNLFGNSVDGFASFGYYDQVNHSQLYINRVKSYRNYGRTDITATRTGSGFLVGGFDGGIIENCEAFDNGKNNRCPSGGPQGFWCYNSKNLVFQYCVSHDNKAGKLFDGGGFDIDGGSQNCTIQYCYSYNNEGAGLAFFEHGSTTQFTNNAIRYNISENDARRNAHGAIMLWAQDTLNRVKNSQIYNNTIYVTPSATASLNYPVGVLYKWTNFQNLSFFNNVIYTIDTVKILVGSYGSTTFSNNNYYTPGKTVNFKKGGVSLDPLFVNAGGGTDGYKVKGASAMINAGKASPATKDFVSTPVPFNGGYDIGAYESILMEPVANAGADQVITLPADLNLTGSGSDEDGAIEGYSWTRTAGPVLCQINTPSNASTMVSNLAEGTYTFRLTVKDNDGKTQYD